MKRFFIFVSVILCVGVFSFMYHTSLTSFKLNKHLYYSVDDNNKLTIYAADEEDKQSVHNSLPAILGEGGIVNVSEVKVILKVLDVKAVNSYSVGDISVTDYFSPRLESFVVVNSHKVNLQVAIKGDIAKIGYPLILDSF